MLGYCVISEDSVFKSLSHFLYSQMHTLENILFQALKTILGLETVVLSFHSCLTWTSVDADLGLCSLPGAALLIGVNEGSWDPEPYFLFYLRGSPGSLVCLGARAGSRRCARLQGSRSWKRRLRLTMEQVSPARGVSSEVGQEGIREEEFIHVLVRGTVNFLNCSACCWLWAWTLSSPRHPDHPWSPLPEE